MLQDLKIRGLGSPSKLAIRDGALGFWVALEEEFKETRVQKCWVHKTANVLDKLPKRVQAHAKKLVHDIYMAPTRVDVCNNSASNEANERMWFNASNSYNGL